MILCKEKKIIKVNYEEEQLLLFASRLHQVS